MVSFQLIRASGRWLRHRNTIRIEQIKGTTRAIIQAPLLAFSCLVLWVLLNKVSNDSSKDVIDIYRMNVGI